MTDRLVLILDEINYSILWQLDKLYRIPADIIEVYEIDCPEAEIRGIKAKPIEMIGGILKQDFDNIIGAMDFDDMLLGVISKLNLTGRYLGLGQFKEKYLDKSGRMQYLKLQMRRKCNDFAHPCLMIGDYTYCIKLELLTGLDQAKCNIGKFCSLSENVRILLGIEHRNDWNTTYPFNSFLDEYKSIKGHPTSKGDVYIGNDVCIGLDTIIMSGVTIGDGCVIGARSVVSRSIPPYCIAAGNPVKVIRKRFSDEIIEILSEIKWWDWDDEIIYEAIPLLQSNNISGLRDYWAKQQR